MRRAGQSCHLTAAIPPPSGPNCLVTEPSQPTISTNVSCTPGCTIAAHGHASVHQGTDYQPIEGNNPLFAVMAGTITYGGSSTALSGYTITIRSGNLEFVYMHVAWDPKMEQGGGFVDVGQVIGEMGNSGQHKDGTSYTKHLHFEIWDISGGGRKRLPPGDIGLQ